MPSPSRRLRAALAPSRGVALLVALAAGVLAPAPLSAGAAPQFPSAPEDLYLEVMIGERSTGRIVFFLHRGGRFFVRPIDLREVGVAVPDDLPLDGEGRVALDAIPGLAYRYEMATQRMFLHPPAALRPVTRLGYRAPPPVVATREAGWLATWTGTGDVTDDRESVGGTLLARRFGRWGALEGSFAGLRGGGSAQLRRIDTRWSYTDPAHLWQWQAGDVVTGGLSWSRPVRMGGLAWSRNFGARPDLVTFPIPRVAGDAAVPSAVQVYVDGLERVGTEIDGGAFEVDVLPRIMGAGEAVLRVTDALGRVNETVVPLYVDAARLAPGLTDFSLQAGVLREGFAGDADRYGRDLVAVGAVRRGLTEAVTLEGYGELGAGLALGGLGAVWSPQARWGVVTASAALSGADFDASAWTLGYQWTGALFGIDLRLRRRGGAFRELADPRAADAAALGWRREQQVTLWARVAGGSLSAASVHWREPTGEGGRVQSIDYTRTVGRITLTGGLLGRTSGTTASLGLSMPLGPRMHGTLQQRHAPGERTTLAGVRRRVPYEGGWGWQARAGEDRLGGVVQGTIEHRSERGDARFGLRLSEGGSSARIEASGSVVAMDGRWFVSRRIHDAFAVVSTSGRAGVPVRIDHRLYGHTGDDGYLLLPDLHGWQDNRVGVDAHLLGWGVRADRPEQVAVPADRTGVRLDFAVSDTRGALVPLRGPEGEPLAPGTPLQVEGADPVVVGLDGEIYLPSLPVGHTIVLHGVVARRSCTFRVRADDATPVRGGYLRPDPVACVEGP
ncbi:fimbria/pilus outer membrane usher protein [Gaopeijia maritima]|uniref:fimbria/pilus outer membrane usher protein n=1 Tax=Gaopeijia maritima TaxID=3119007 RepID=UPI00329512BF